VLQHVVFGEVLSGQDVIRRIEQEAASDDGKPVKPVMIADCGVLEGESGDAALEEPDSAEVSATGAAA
jgi:cyclophilin family peptidyl-prolyl cis-trans isomerase